MPTRSSGAGGAASPHSIAVVVVHYMNIDDTIACLGSLRAVDCQRLAVVVVDNASRDLDTPRIEAAFPGAMIVASSTNLGFAGGCNLGIARALAAGADLIMLLNNDAMAHPALFRRLLPIMEDPAVGIVGPVIAYYDTPERVWFGPGIYSRLLGYAYRARPLAPFGGERQVDFVNGCALLARRAVFERVGPLWDGFFLYFEEVDFCLRAAAAGFRCVLVGDPLVLHKVSASGGRRGGGGLTADQAYYFGRNPILLLARVARGPWWLGGMLAQFAVILPFHALQSLRGEGPRALGACLAGMRDGMLGRTGPRPSPDRGGAAGA